MAPHLMYTPEKCLHCEKTYTPSQGCCFYCRGYTLPTRTHSINGMSTLIQWNTFELHPTSSDAVKRTMMKSATMAIEKNLYVAVFGYRFWDNEETLKTVVFVHRPGGEKRLSIRKTAYSSRCSTARASPRDWDRIVAHEWEQFVDIAGEIPEGFPEPANYPDSDDN